MQVVLTKQERKRVEAIAKAEGIPIEEAVERLVREALESRKVHAVGAGPERLTR